MKVVIVGNRNFNLSHHNLSHILNKNSLKNIERFLVRKKTGIDRSVKTYCLRNDLEFSERLGDYSRYGKAAGPIRDRELAQEADILIVICLLGQTDSDYKSIKNEFKRLKKRIIVENHKNSFPRTVLPVNSPERRARSQVLDLL
ncbi:MAG: hypothetical protein PHY47_00840 [Lachnospiraceae bacterium]|nr:hypothetical protein [Lachnospiraceae bacterium]